MRILFFLIVSVLLFASTDKIEREIFATIIDGLYPDRQSVRVWSDDMQKRELLASIPKVSLVDSPQKAETSF